MPGKVPRTCFGGLISLSMLRWRVVTEERLEGAGVGGVKRTCRSVKLSRIPDCALWGSWGTRCWKCSWVDPLITTVRPQTNGTRIMNRRWERSSGRNSKVRSLKRGEGKKQQEKKNKRIPTFRVRRRALLGSFQVLPRYLHATVYGLFRCDRH